MGVTLDVLKCDVRAYFTCDNCGWPILGIPRVDPPAGVRDYDRYTHQGGECPDDDSKEKGDSMKLTLKLQDTALVRYPCFTCGQATNKDVVQAFAYDEDGDEHGAICDACLASPSALIVRAKARATNLHEWAAALEHVVVESFVTLEQKAEMVREREVGFDDHFGVCPKCHRGGECRNIGRDHWFFCAEHRVKWFVGSNLFSSWRHESEADWRKNADYLADFIEVQEARRAIPSRPELERPLDPDDLLF